MPAEKFMPRRRVGARVASDAPPKLPASTSFAGMMTEEEVDDSWQRLLEDTLPPDKQISLMKTYSEEQDPRQRYNMLLEVPRARLPRHRSRAHPRTRAHARAPAACAFEVLELSPPRRR